jgi:hypothetical protein
MPKPSFPHQEKTTPPLENAKAPGLGREGASVVEDGLSRLLDSAV